jgi:hypothetical protein
MGNDSFPLDRSLAAAAAWLSELGNTHVDHIHDSTGLMGQLSLHDVLVGYTHMYVSTRNPIFAWQAFLTCRWENMPDWIREFIEDQGIGIVRLSYDGALDDNEKLARLAAELGFSSQGRRGNAFRNHRESNAQAKIATLYERSVAEGTKSYMASDDVARRAEVSKATVMNYVKSWQRLWNEQRSLIKKTKRGTK